MACKPAKKKSPTIKKGSAAHRAGSVRVSLASNPSRKKRNKRPRKK